MTNLMALLKSPNQAGNIYTQSGKPPKQRHTFLVRFHPNNNDSSLTSMTFAVKSVDRPSIQPHSEELNQYNRKRHVYTGYKTQPVKMVFYDSGDQAAMKMWESYSRYYFGDFSKKDSAFSGKDIVGPTLNDPANDFGFTAKNGGKGDTDSQFFFKSIEILHFHGKTYDLYELVNPRITQFDPDDLDYEQAGVSVINSQFVYEAILFTSNAGSGNVDEFKAGAQFDARSIDSYNNEPYTPDTIYPQYTDSNYGSYSQPQNAAFMQSILGNTAANSFTQPVDYRYKNQQSGSGIGLFGQFGFGSNSGNPLSSILGNGNNPLSALLSNRSNPAGISSGLFNQAASIVNGAMGGNASSAFGQKIIGGLLASLTNSTIPAGFSPTGMIMTPAAYGTVNANQSGTSQIGFNNSAAAADSNTTQTSPPQNIPTPTSNPGQSSYGASNPFGSTPPQNVGYSTPTYGASNPFGNTVPQNVGYSTPSSPIPGDPQSPTPTQTTNTQFVSSSDNGSIVQDASTTLV